MAYNVILVDDEQWNRDLIRTLGQWEAHGLHVTGEAEDGEEALKLVADVLPDIVITDMRMPGMDGVQLMEQIHSRYPGIRIVVISGYDDFNYLKQAIRYQAVDYLLKPVDPKELNAILGKCAKDLAAAAAKATDLPLDLSLALASYKQLLSRHFNELNPSGIRQTMEQIRAELTRRDMTQDWQQERIVSQLMLALKESMNANSLPVEAIEQLGKGVAAGETTLGFMEEQYLTALEQLIATRKFKNKLNVEEIKTYIERHFAENVTLDQLAKAFFVSKEYLSKVFKQEYGRNLTDYILHLRMEKAKDWLLDEQLSIKAVAEMAGYEDVTYFYRVFKKHYGVAPGEMRKHNQV
ncbi:response regulator [Paenibacillus aurantiacus]|uniref:Response regulator n=1 Tax=Paenibacillus aurantiacus TaxID=1936118 RepID=A0ABV5KRQ1_9BACL